MNARKLILTAALALIAVPFLGTTAQAGPVSIGVGINLGGPPAPVYRPYGRVYGPAYRPYYGPRPVVVAAPPVVVQAPPRVIYAPPPVVIQTSPGYTTAP